MPCPRAKACTADSSGDGSACVRVPHAQNLRLHRGSTVLSGTPRVGIRGVIRGGLDALRRVLELFHPTLWLRTLLASTATFASACGYYAVVLAQGNIGGDIYTTNLLGALLEVPSYLVIPIVGDRLGRTKGWALVLAGTAIPLLAVGLLSPASIGHSGRLGLALTARFFAATASAMPYIAATELYPTTSRSTALAFITASGRIGTLLSPVIATVLTVRTQAITVGIGTAVGAVCALSLPETLGKPMAERVSDPAALLVGG